MFSLLKYVAFSSSYGSGGYGLRVVPSNTSAASLSAFIDNLSTWGIIAMVLAACGALVAYFFFARQPRNNFKGFATRLHDFVNFKRLRVEAIVKILYLFMALFTTLFSFELISVSFLGFLTTLVGGNIGLWITFQFAMIIIKIYRNLVEINEKLGKKK
ncbi:MAG: hypothetical protein ACOX0Z_00145 [Candidatus Nanosyncoccaceae bacterium]|jgi:hypothetical protein